MCSYQTLFLDDNTGYVVRCNKCDNIQSGFGNLMLTISSEDFHMFRNWLKKTIDEQSALNSEAVRCIVIPTPCAGVKLLLSLRELKEFDHMLDEADTELQSSRLLKLFDPI